MKGAQRTGRWRWIILRVLDNAARGLFRSSVARVVFAVWLLIFLVAPLRRIASTTQQNDNIYFNGFEHDEYNMIDDYSERRAKEALDKIVALPKERALAHTENGRGVEEKNLLFDKLIRKYPYDAVIVARYLCNAFSNSNIGLERQVNYAASTPVEISSSVEQLQQQRERLNQIIAVAKRGRKIEPDNAFFGAVLVVCYVELKRDADAYRVLERSRKTIYDAHSMDILRATAAELKQIYPHLVEYQIALVNWDNWQSDFGFSNAAEVLAQENWRADQHHKMQNRAWRLRSLQRRADIARMLAKISLGRSAQVQQDYRRTLFKVWRNDWTRQNFGRLTYLYQNTVLSERFAREATSLGQLQIAAETRDFAAKNAQIHRVVRSIGNDDRFGFQKLRWLSRLQLLVIGQIALFAALYVVAALFLIRTEKTPTDFRRARFIAIAGSCGGALFLAVAYSLVASGTFNALDPNMSGKTIALFTTSLPAFFAMPLMAIPLSLAASRPRGDTPIDANCGLKDKLEKRLIEYSLLPPLRKLLDFAWFSVLSQLWVFAAINFVNQARGVWSYDLPFLGNLQTDVATGFVCLSLSFPVIVAYFLMLWRWPNFASQRASSHAKLRGFRAACGAMLATGSVLFLLCLLASLPTRRDIAQKFDKYLQHDGLWLVTGKTGAQ